MYTTLADAKKAVEDWVDKMPTLLVRIWKICKHGFGDYWPYLALAINDDPEASETDRFAEQLNIYCRIDSKTFLKSMTTLYGGNESPPVCYEKLTQLCNNVDGKINGCKTFNDLSKLVLGAS